MWYCRHKITHFQIIFLYSWMSQGYTQMEIPIQCHASPPLVLSVGFMHKFISLKDLLTPYICVCLCVSFLSSYILAYVCVCSFPCVLVCVHVCFFCVHGAVSNRGRHDRVGKARERTRGKGAARQAHPAGTRRPGAGHRSQQVWTLLRSSFPPLPSHISPPLARHSTAQPGLAQKAPKQRGDCIGLIQQTPADPMKRLS